jgi:hypothetical protein
MAARNDRRFSEFSGAVAAVAILLMAGSALAGNECAGLPRHNALSDFFGGIAAGMDPEIHGRHGVDAGEERAERGQALQISYEDALRNKVITGTPASVAMRLKYLTGKVWGMAGSSKSQNATRSLGTCAIPGLFAIV